MTPEAARAMYLRQIVTNGETVTLRRLGSPNIDKNVRAAELRGKEAPKELVGAVQQTARGWLALAEDIESSGFPTPFREKFDKVISVYGEATMGLVLRRRVGATDIGFEFWVLG